MMTQLLKCLKVQIRMRRDLMSDSNHLESLGRYTKIDEFKPGDSFGEVQLLYDEPRQESILAAKSCFFLTITKEHY